jgi:LacI family transcriptional regulator
MKTADNTLYQKIVADIQNRLAKGEYAVGQRMYSIDEAMKYYNVSSTTAVRAVDELKKLGIIKSIKGKGSFFAKGLSQLDSELVKSVKLKRITILTTAFNIMRDNFQTKICAGIEEQAEAEGINIRIENISPANISDTDAGYLASADEGIIAINGSPSFALYSILKDVSANSVIIDSYIPGICSITTENYEGIKQLIDQLYSKGHRKIILGNYHPEKPNLLNEEERNNAFDIFTKDRKIKTEKIPAVNHEKILEYTKKGFTAVLFTQDHAAYSFMRSAENKGIRIPEDLSVAGFDGDFSERGDLPQLVTVEIDKAEMGKTAVKMLVMNNSPEKTSRQYIKIKGHLIKGRTVSNIK